MSSEPKPVTRGEHADQSFDRIPGFACAFCDCVFVANDLRGFQGKLMCSYCHEVLRPLSDDNDNYPPEWSAEWYELPAFIPEHVAEIERLKQERDEARAVIAETKDILAGEILHDDAPGMANFDVIDLPGALATFASNIRCERDEARAEVERLKPIEAEFKAAVFAMSDYLQCGAPYENLMKLGMSLTKDGPRVLVAEIERLTAIQNGLILGQANALMEVERLRAEAAANAEALAIGQAVQRLCATTSWSLSQNARQEFIVTALTCHGLVVGELCSTIPAAVEAAMKESEE